MFWLTTQRHLLKEKRYCVSLLFKMFHLCKLVSPLWEAVWKFRKLTIGLSGPGKMALLVKYLLQKHVWSQKPNKQAEMVGYTCNPYVVEVGQVKPEIHAPAAKPNQWFLCYWEILPFFFFLKKKPENSWETPEVVWIYIQVYPNENIHVHAHILHVRTDT